MRCADDRGGSHSRRIMKGMTRRDFVRTAVLAANARPAAPAPLIVPVRLVKDSRAKFTPEQVRHFDSVIWPEAVRDFQRGGIQFQLTAVPGEIKRSPSSRPIFTGLERGVINLMITDHVPMDYAALGGVTTRYEGYHLCVIALSDAHGNQVPYFSTNTCVHELLHLLLQDVYLNRPKWYQTGEREFRIDWYATRLWLFHDGDTIRKSTEAYLARLKAGG
jgi:hypothetical protein